MVKYMDYLQGMDSIAVIIRLVIATICGSLIGWERIVRRHSAGIRTFSLVSLGSAVAAVLNIYLASSATADMNVTPGDLAIVYTIANSVGPITMISGGWFNDKFGPRKVILVGGIMWGLGMFLSGFRLLKDPKSRLNFLLKWLGLFQNSRNILRRLKISSMY